jgi:hypothetical protein
MVTVTLARQWTDENGATHAAGSQVRIPESQLDDLVAAGFVDTKGGEDGDWVRWT